MGSKVIADRIGFGCASLFALPSPSGRRAVLEHAYDLGIRHFDIAPIYGLGRAEVELARFRAQHPDIRITTKFGLTLTTAGRVAGLVQRPVRALLSRRPGLKNQVKESGKGPDAGSVGSALYRSGEYSVDEARAALDRSRRLLGVDRIDTFLAHEPALAMAHSEALVDWLRAQQEQGAIGAWGPAGELPRGTADSTAFYTAAPVIQHPYDLTTSVPADASHVGTPTSAKHVLFGFLAGTLPTLLSLLATDPNLRSRCSGELGQDLVDAELPALLLRDAIRASADGMVLVSTTNTGHLTSLGDAASPGTATTGEEAACVVLRSALRSAVAPA